MTRGETTSFTATPEQLQLYGDWRTLFQANGITRWVKRFRMKELPDGRVKITCELSQNH